MIKLGKKILNNEIIKKIIFDNIKIEIDPQAEKHINNVYNLAKDLANQQTIYGLNTGFGGLAETKISKNLQEELQYNILLSHACGVGEALDFYTAKTILLLRLNTLLQGYSLASPSLLSSLVKLLNANCAPYIPKKGSVGASGDLAPLAHLGLLLLGIGEAFIDNKKTTAKNALKQSKIENFKLYFRDGLALINGTQAMSASGFTSLLDSFDLCDLADITAACTIEALGGHNTPYDQRIQMLKPYPGQIISAKNIRSMLKGSKRKSFINNPLTQDPYSLRCVPQVHGASRDVSLANLKIIETEINSTTDNPLFFIKNNKFDILFGGNFHGQQLAIALDHQALGVAELANISERRIELLLNPKHSNGLPAFLINPQGSNSGFMMLHVTASALINENKILSHPASTDSIPTSANREDHVSMGMTAANKLKEIIKNTKIVLTIELLASLQALNYRNDKSISPKIMLLHKEARKIVAFYKKDCLFINDLNKINQWLDTSYAKNLIKDLLTSKSNNPSI